MALQRGFQPLTITADGFRLQAYRHHWRSAPRSLHVYLEGDGRPWETTTRIGADPTPRRPLALELMALDPSPSLYLGRPCYFGQADAPGCNPMMWTFARYSETVVNAMRGAIERVVTQERIQAVTLIGYSGGGVIAWLLAERIPQVTQLITIAANLDVQAWASYHGFSPLVQSLDPARRAPLRAMIQQWHLVGTRDREVPPSLSIPLSDTLLAQAQILEFDTDHRCCWAAHWGAFIASLQQPN